jgi:hypothetical protein
MNIMNKSIGVGIRIVLNLFNKSSFQLANFPK